jgi:5-(carboxyamino)imidazole ribonucleotide synthase
VTLVACIGGGQLGRMLGLAGIPLGLEFRFLDPSPQAPARAVGELLVGAYEDELALRRLASGADVVTYEFENVPAASARAIRALPDARALEATRDRLEEKRLLRRLDIPTPEFESPALPALAKRRTLGYDGKGQRLVSSLEELGDDEIAEEVVSFRRELSILAVRSTIGETAFYPLVENTHRDGILRLSRVPAEGAPDAAARVYATRLLDELGYAGVLALELFETLDGRLLANEVAPRVHNSGHWTIEGARTSQFENHLRAILGLPLGSTDAPEPVAMVNLIGEVPALERLLRVPGAHVHLYGKAPRPGRKLGHVTLVGDAVEALDELLPAH